MKSTSALRSWRPTALLLGCLLSLCLCSLDRPVRADVFGSGANSFEIEFVTIGNPGNPPDTTGAPKSAGSVPYVYRIGKYEISEQIIDKANALGGLGITQFRHGPNKPASGVNWYEAAQFINWLNTSSGNTPAYKFDASGVFQLWQPGDRGYDAANLFRNRLAKYFLPGVHEWYKAAYYDPTKGIYYDYPTGSDSIPDGRDFAGDPVFDAVFDNGLRTVEPNDVTNVGLLSPYGTAGQGGNAWEFEETEADLVNDLSSLFSYRGFRGGSWNSEYDRLWSSDRRIISPFDESGKTGFRVASIPEPTSAIHLLLRVCLWARGGFR